MSRLENSWGLILGGSSGIGLASAKKLAREGMNLILVHRDRRGSMAQIEEEFAKIREFGVQILTLNQDALAPDSRHDIKQKCQNILRDSASKIQLVLHSIALGNLKSAAPKSATNQDDSTILQEDDLAQTIFNMGSSLLVWVQELHKAELLGPDTRVLGLSSEGSHIAWEGYAAVSAAKAALEALSRSIAKEFAPHGIRCNILQAGLTDTKALRLIPGHEYLKSNALHRNPFKRLTTPEDVANVVYLMALKEAAWINGAVIRVDGGEAISQS